MWKAEKIRVIRTSFKEKQGSFAEANVAAEVGAGIQEENIEP